MAPIGAPPYVWRPEIEAELFERIAKGEAIRNICADDWLPSWPTFRLRLINDPDFATRYAVAREAQADAIFDEVQQIADMATPESVAVDRLRIDTRKWRAGKLRPKVYGEKLAIGGADDLPPVQTEEVGAGNAKLMAFLNAIAERSGDAG